MPPLGARRHGQQVLHGLIVKAVLGAWETWLTGDYTLTVRAGLGIWEAQSTGAPYVNSQSWLGCLGDCGHHNLVGITHQQLGTSVNYAHQQSGGECPPGLTGA